MKMRRFALLALCLLVRSNASAELGNVSASSEGDRGVLHAKEISEAAGSKSCYSVKILNGENAGAKEFINTSTDRIFMIRAHSRSFINVHSLLGSVNFEEFQKIPKSSSNSQHTRNHRQTNAESSRLKIRVERAGFVHHALLIQKDAVPECVTNPETLP